MYAEKQITIAIASENYSERIAIKIRTLELLSVFDMLCLVILIVIQTLAAMKMAVLNKLLEQRAYTDTHTGLPNKSCLLYTSPSPRDS